MINVDGAVSFSLLEANHATDLTARGNDDYRVYIYSVAARAHLNKMDCGYWLLQEMHCFTMTNGFIFTSQSEVNFGIALKYDTRDMQFHTFHNIL